MEFKAVFSKVAMSFLVLSFVVSLAACNTIEGAGEDIEKGAESIQDAAD